jgi:hypothetical protein
MPSVPTIGEELCSSIAFAVITYLLLLTIFYINKPQVKPCGLTSYGEFYYKCLYC